MASVYLDYNATAPLCAEAKAAMTAALDAGGNPSSVHAEGRAARRLVEDAREALARTINAAPGDIVFTSGATEANNLALRARGVERILVSETEHDSVLAPAVKAGLPVKPLSVGPDGVVDLDGLERALADGEGRALVCVMLANNETGVIQPIKEIVRLSHGAGALVLCDIVQGVGKLPLDLAALDIDLASLSAHKIAGPKGAGALVIRNGVEVAPLIAGGGQEMRRRAGTENLTGIAGFGAAAERCGAMLDAQKEIETLRDAMEIAMRDAVPGAVFHGAGAKRLGNTLSVSLPGVTGETQVMALDLDGFCVSAGSACSSGKVGRSHVLSAMGVPDELADSAIRVSLGMETTQEETDAFVARWARLAKRATMKAAS